MSQDEIDRMAQKAEKSWAESESNKAKIEAKNGFGNYWLIMRNTLNEELLKDNSKLATGRRSRLQYRKPWAGWDNINWFLSSRAATIRTRCLEQASRDCEYGAGGRGVLC